MNSKTENYQEAVTVISRLKDEQLRTLLITYFKGKLEYYGRDELCTRYTNDFCRRLKEINDPGIEFYLEYCLEYFKDVFAEFLRVVYLICQEVNFALKSVESNYLRYCGKGELDALIYQTFMHIIPENPNEEFTNSIKAIIDIEKNHIIALYNRVKGGKKC